MTERCEPPPELRGVDGWHWVQDRTGDPVVRRWLAGPYPAWRHLSMPSTAELAYQAGYRYVAPVTAAATVAALAEALEEARGVLVFVRDQFGYGARATDEKIATALAIYRGRP